MSLNFMINALYGREAEMQAFVKALPREFESEGEQIFANNRNVLKTFVVKEGHPVLGKVVVKRFRSRHVFQTLAYSLFVRSKAFRAYHHAIWLYEKWKMTPEPIAFVEESHWGMLRYCYYVSAYTSACSVRDELETEDFNRQIANSFALAMARMHENGTVHHDLNFSNVLYQWRNLKPEIILIDINRATIKYRKRLPLKDCRDDFVRWTDRKELLQYVMEEYAKARGLDVPSTLEQVMEMKAVHDRNWKRRKSLKRWLKRMH